MSRKRRRRTSQGDEDEQQRTLCDDSVILLPVLARAKVGSTTANEDDDYFNNDSPRSAVGAVWFEIWNILRLSTGDRLLVKFYDRFRRQGFVEWHSVWDLHSFISGENTNQKDLQQHGRCSRRRSSVIDSRCSLYIPGETDRLVEVTYREARDRLYCAEAEEGLLVLDQDTYLFDSQESSSPVDFSLILKRVEFDQYSSNLLQQSSDDVHAPYCMQPPTEIRRRSLRLSSVSDLCTFELLCGPLGQLPPVGEHKHNKRRSSDTLPPQQHPLCSRLKRSVEICRQQNSTTLEDLASTFPIMAPTTKKQQPRSTSSSTAAASHRTTPTQIKKKKHQSSRSKSSKRNNKKTGRTTASQKRHSASCSEEDRSSGESEQETEDQRRWRKQTRLLIPASKAQRNNHAPSAARGEPNASKKQPVSTTSADRCCPTQDSSNSFAPSDRDRLEMQQTINWDDCYAPRTNPDFAKDADDVVAADTTEDLRLDTLFNYGCEPRQQLSITYMSKRGFAMAQRFTFPYAQPARIMGWEPYVVSITGYKPISVEQSAACKPIAALEAAVVPPTLPTQQPTVVPFGGATSRREEYQFSCTMLDELTGARSMQWVSENTTNVYLGLLCDAYCRFRGIRRPACMSWMLRYPESVPGLVATSEASVAGAAEQGKAAALQQTNHQLECRPVREFVSKLDFQKSTVFCERSPDEPCIDSCLNKKEFWTWVMSEFAKELHMSSFELHPAVASYLRFSLHNRLSASLDYANGGALLRKEGG